MAYEEFSAETIAQIYKAAGDSVTVIDTAKRENQTDEEYKDKIKRNTDHLEIIKKYKKNDKTTSIWTNEDFTDIDAAIELGKTKY